MASASSGSNVPANVMRQHQVWGRVEAVPSAGSCSGSGSQHSNSHMQDTRWLSSSDYASSGSQSAFASVQPEGDDAPLPSMGSEGPLPSIGSRGHAIGKCKQCHHFNSPTGCDKGEACTYCHLHVKAKRSRTRPGKAVRGFAKSQAQILDAMTNVEELKQAAGALLSQNRTKYMQKLVKQKLKAKGVTLKLPGAHSDPESSMDGESGSGQDIGRSAASKEPPRTNLQPQLQPLPQSPPRPQPPQQATKSRRNLVSL